MLYINTRARGTEVSHLKYPEGLRCGGSRRRTNRIECHSNIGITNRSHTFSIDIDECKTSKNTCAQICKNILGGFICLCREGYRRVGDKCIGMC